MRGVVCARMGGSVGWGLPNRLPTGRGDLAPTPPGSPINTDGLAGTGGATALRTSGPEAEAGQGRSRVRVAPIGGPRRLNTSTASCRPARGEHARRSGAGLLHRRAAAGRSAMSGVAPACAARCKRRKVGPGQGPGFHHSTAAQLPARRACSTAQAASARLAGLTHTSRASATFMACKALVQGTPGGATQSNSCAPSSRRSSAPSQGWSSANSPLADAGNNSSIKPASGQPPPGSSASSAAQPVGAVGTAKGEIALACHTSEPNCASASGRFASRAAGAKGVQKGRADMAAGRMTVHKYSYRLQDLIRPGRVHPLLQGRRPWHSAGCNRWMRPFARERRAARRLAFFNHP